jgi:hypothetical protein
VEQVHVVGFATLVNNQHDAALALQQLVPVKNLLHDGSIAGGVVEMGVVEGAAQAAGDALGRGSMSEAQCVEFSGDLSDDGRLSGEDASGEQGETVAGSSWDASSDGCGDALAKSLIEWKLSGHE